jgi:D-alanine-D-alanine ligase
MPALDRVAVLFGGASSEHSISLRSGATMVASLARAGFEVTPVVVGKDGVWSILSREQVEAGLPPEVEGQFPKAAIFGTALPVAMELVQQKIQVVVLGLHGTGGEDGSIQGFLQTAGLAYTGPGVATSAIAMDKVLLKHILRSAGLPTAEWLDLGWPEGPEGLARSGALAAAWARKHGYPVVVKARTLGSSVGVGFAPDARTLNELVATIGARGAGLFVECAVEGTEVSCGVFGRGTTARPLPAIEIVPKKGAWFDFDSKYDAGGALERIPAKIPKRMEAEVQRLALRVHCLIGADGITRTDIILGDDGPVILETNTLPGMTETSLVPQEAKAVGWSLETLLTMLVEAAWHKWHPEAAPAVPVVPPYNQPDERVRTQANPDHRSGARAGKRLRGGRGESGRAGRRDDGGRPRARSPRR